MFFGSVVTENFYILYSSLGAFTYAYLMIYRIAIYRSLHGFCLEKQIAIIHIQAIDITSFLGELFTQSLVKRFNIINIAFPYSQDKIQNRIRVLCISFPGYIAEIIFSSFVDFKINVTPAGNRVC